MNQNKYFLLFLFFLFLFSCSKDEKPTTPAPDIEKTVVAILTKQVEYSLTQTCIALSFTPTITPTYTLTPDMTQTVAFIFTCVNNAIATNTSIAYNTATPTITISPTCFCVDFDGDGAPYGDCCQSQYLDCDDFQSSISPYNHEFCNKIDDNCDGIIDNDVYETGQTCYYCYNDFLYQGEKLCIDGFVQCINGQNTNLSCDVTPTLSPTPTQICIFIDGYPEDNDNNNFSNDYCFGYCSPNLIFIQFEFNNDIVINVINIKVSNPTFGYIGLYNDTNNLPNNLLYQFNPSVPIDFTEGWQSIKIPNINISQNTKIWIAIGLENFYLRYNSLSTNNTFLFLDKPWYQISNGLPSNLNNQNFNTAIGEVKIYLSYCQ
ncbi:MAG: putative metal-binding motif-containing protein [Candidatus Goldbacteria bacterium]|nr:putative metal-binding motif-containing protein [Candidatus Goldiibacteriota bacterium]